MISFKVVGIDPSTCTGVVVLDKAGELVQSRVIHFPTAKGMDRVQLIAQAVSSFLDQYNPTHGVIEGYAFGNRNTLVTLVEIGTLLRLELHRRGMPWIEVQPTALKKFCTGKGNAKKPDMAKSVKERWGFNSASDDVIDAYSLARFGLHHFQGMSL